LIGAGFPTTFRTSCWCNASASHCSLVGIGLCCDINLMDDNMRKHEKVSKVSEIFRNLWMCSVVEYLWIPEIWVDSVWNSWNMAGPQRRQNVSRVVAALNSTGWHKNLVAPKDLRRTQDSNGFYG
jgi:hypothetical protein